MRGGRRAIRSLAGALVMVMLVAGCTGTADRSKGVGSGGILRLAVAGLASYDPAEVVPTAQAEMVAADLVADGLTAVDARTGAVEAALATGWSADPAGTTWTFTLRAGATFSDGSALSAADVAASLTRVAARGNTSLAGARLDGVVGYADLVGGRSQSLAGVRAVDARTLAITTAAPDAELPLLLGSPVFGVVKVGGKVVPSTSTGTTIHSGVELVGSGPFRVASDDGTTLRLVRSPGSSARLDGVDLVRVANAAAGDAAVREGAADWASLAGAATNAGPGSPAPVPAAAQRDGTASTVTTGTAPPDTRVVNTPLGAEEFFGMNVANPVLANPLFRQAIVKAIDRAKLATLGPAGLRASSAVVPRGVAGAVSDPCGAPCAYDPVAAKALVDQAFPTGVVPTLEIGTDDVASDVALATAIQLGLGAVSIPAKVVVKPFAEYKRYLTTGQQQLFRTGWVGLSPSPGAYLDPLFRSNSLDNLVTLASANVDTRLATARATKDDRDRVSQYQLLERDVLGLFPVVPVGSYVGSVRVSPRVRDYLPRLDGTFDAVLVSLGPK